MKRSLVAGFAVLLTLCFMVGCGSGQKAGEEAPSAAPVAPEGGGEETGGREFTLEELKGYDGKEGRPAYVAVDGVVYDLSESGYWLGGKHGVCPLDSMAGNDLSEEIKQAPARMYASLQRFPVVGTLAP